jgi:ribosomal protein S21
MFDAVTSDSFYGWTVDTELEVRAENFSGVDAMLEELSRRLEKNGRLKAAEQNRRYTKPSDERRQEREAQAYRAQADAERRWRGGVQQ